jgi:hypothetical protein
MANEKSKAIINAATEAGNANGKLATAINKALQGLRKPAAEKLRDETYAEYLAGRKTRDLSETERRPYDAMRTAFSRAFKAKGWTASKAKSNNAAKPKEVTHAGMLQWIDAGIDAVQETDGADFEVDKAIALLKDFKAKFNALKPATK